MAGVMLEVISAYYFADDTDVQHLVKELSDLIAKYGLTPL